MTTTSLSTFKDLVATIEKSKTLIEEHELLSDEELNSLKQTSSLVAKFQKEALVEKENRVSAELIAKEKERLVSDAWKIVSALKKDKYALELQLERLKSNKPVERRLSNKRLSGENKDNQPTKPSPKTKRTTNIKDQPRKVSHESNELSSEGLKTTNSSDSKEKQDSVKESIEEDLYSDKEPTTHYESTNHDLYSAGTEDDEVEVEETSSDPTNNARGDHSDRRYSPSDMIKLWTAKPYTTRRRLQEVESKNKNERSLNDRKEKLSRIPTYKAPSKRGFGKYNFGHNMPVKEDTSQIEFSSTESVVDHNTVMGTKCVALSNHHAETKTHGIADSPKKASPSDSTRRTLGYQERVTDTTDVERYGRHAPKKVSPLVCHSVSSSKEARPKYAGVRRSRDYINLLDPQIKENYASGKNTMTKISKQEKPDVTKPSKTDSSGRLITSPKGLPGGIVSKRIQDLAKRLTIGHITAPSKKTDAMPYSDYMDLRNPCPGLCGLENLGNSCFMNAGLQCLFVIKPFYRFFLEGGHLSLLKNKSKSHQSNSLSILLGGLIDKVFSGCYLTCEPSALFNCLQSKFPQLDAFRQHDCQEFLALFLDALHQELNTANRNFKWSIRRQNDAVKQARNADSWWSMYNEENESVIVDTFQGQFRNKITCSECGHVSITYQLFSFLSLPLVSQKMQSFVITFIHNNRPELINSSKPKAIRLRVQASKPSTTMQIKQRLVSLLPEDERPDFNNLFLAVVRDSSIVGLLHDDLIVTPFNDKHTKLYAYEPLHPPTIGSPSIKSTRDRSDMKLHPNVKRGATATYQPRESLRLKEKNFVMLPLGNIDDPHGLRNRRGTKTRASLPVGYHLTFECSVCLQARPSKELLLHDECGKVFCRECLQISLEEENISCPDCTRPSSTGRSKELNSTYVNVPVMLRHREPDSEGECTLFGHPNLVTLPYKVTGEDLYSHLAALMSVSPINKKTRAIQTLPFTIHLVNYQGRYCSRCERIKGCTGCCIQEDDILVLQNGDHLAIQLTNIIQLEIDKMSRYCDHESMRIKHLTCRLQLQDCLRSFVDREELQDLWPCPECNQERSVTKSMSVVRYPDTLIIHLKRYSQNNMKIFTPVEFPLDNLDMSEFMHGINSPRESYSTGDYVYDLMGCVCHDGDFEGGHYTAYTRHGIKAEWCLFDDYKVTKECPSSSSCKKVYLLFYNRRSGSPLSTSIDETITPTKIASSKNKERRASLEDRYDARKQKKKSFSKIDKTIVRETVRDADQHHLKMNSNSTSTPKEQPKQNSRYGKTEGLTKNIIHRQENINGVTINVSKEQEQSGSVTVTIDRQQGKPHKQNVYSDHQKKQQHCLTVDTSGDLQQEQPDSMAVGTDEQQEQSAQCECSQCDYFRELEQQIRRCRRSISGTKTRELSGETGSMPSRGVPPKTTSHATSKQRTPVKNTTPVKEGYRMTIPKLPEKSPPLASSDSLDSELDDQYTITNQVRTGEGHKTSNYSPTSTSPDPPTDTDADVEPEGSRVIVRRRGSSGVCYREDDSDKEAEGRNDNRGKKKSSRLCYREDGSNEEATESSSNNRRRSVSKVHHRKEDTTDDTEGEDSSNTKRTSSSWLDIKGDDTDNESVTTKTTDNAVQCTLLDEQDMEFDPEYCSYRRSTANKNKVDSGVQVSFTRPKYSQRNHDETSDEQNLDKEEIEFLTRKLIFAVENEDIRHALQLLKEGASPSLLIDGVTAIHLSAGMISSLGFHFTRLFLEFGANPNVKSADGVTPVHVAAMWGQKECLKLLLRKGGNPYSEDTEGRNAVELAKIFESDTSAVTAEYLSRLDEHYSSLIYSESLSNVSLTSQISTSELEYMPYLYEGEDCRPRRTRKQLAEFVIPRPEMTTDGSTVPVGCSSWTRKLRKKVKKNKLMRTVSGNLLRTSSRLADRFRSIGDHFVSNTAKQRQSYIDESDSDT